MFTYWPYNEIILNKVKSLKCSEPILVLRSHSDLGQWIAPHFCISDYEWGFNSAKTKC